MENFITKAADGSTKMMRNNKPILFVVDEIESLRSCNEFLQNHGLSGREYKIAAFRASESSFLTPGLKSRLITPELSDEEKSRLDDLATELANRWPFLKSVKRDWIFEQINLSSLIAHGMDYFFIWVLKQARMVKQIIESVEPSLVILQFGVPLKGPFFAPLESYYARVAQDYCDRHNIPY